MWGSYGIHTIMIRDKDYSLQTCQQFIFVNQASCYMKKDTYEHTGETTCAVNVEEKTFLWSVSYILNFLTPGLFAHSISNYIGFLLFSEYFCQSPSVLSLFFNVFADEIYKLYDFTIPLSLYSNTMILGLADSMFLNSLRTNSLYT